MIKKFLMYRQTPLREMGKEGSILIQMFRFNEGSVYYGEIVVEAETLNIERTRKFEPVVNANPTEKFFTLVLDGFVFSAI